jgi:hypothetical protein
LARPGAVLDYPYANLSSTTALPQDLPSISREMFPSIAAKAGGFQDTRLVLQPQMVQSAESDSVFFQKFIESLSGLLIFGASI